MKLLTEDRKKIYAYLKSIRDKLFNINELNDIVKKLTNEHQTVSSEQIKNYMKRFIYFDSEQNIFKFNFSKARDKSSFSFGIEELKTNDDILNEDELRRVKIVKHLKSIIYPAQRTLEWYNQRKAMITASDGGTVLDMNGYEKQFNFIIKKITNTPFKGNKFCYHGKKYEKIALMLYENIMDVKVADFGLIQHPVYPFIGASPDGIIDEVKSDGISKTKYVGRMIEIKCPMTRKIKTTGKDICPLHYWVQVQLQLEACDLDECDFWQCSIFEYKDRNEFIEDTKENEQNKSKKSNMHKGCLIQLIKSNVKNYEENLFEHAIFIYPETLNMTPDDCDKWTLNTLSTYRQNKEYDNYIVDKVIYWRFDVASNYLIKRDKEWFKKHLSTFEKMWNYVNFFRNNEKQKERIVKYIENLQVKNNNEVMEIIDKMYNKDKSVEKIMNDIIEDNGYIPFD
jgi:putative phage-type endonuclease